jgi:hypothetical protein
MLCTMNRFHGFLLVSARLVGAAIVAAGLLAGSFFRRHVLAEEEAHTAVPSLSKPFVWEEVRRIVQRALHGGSLAPSSPAPRRP